MSNNFVTDDRFFFFSVLTKSLSPNQVLRNVKIVRIFSPAIDRVYSNNIFCTECNLQNPISKYLSLRPNFKTPPTPQLTMTCL